MLPFRCPCFSMGVDSYLFGQHFIHYSLENQKPLIDIKIATRMIETAKHADWMWKFIQQFLDPQVDKEQPLLGSRLLPHLLPAGARRKFKEGKKQLKSPKTEDPLKAFLLKHSTNNNNY